MKGFESNIDKGTLGNNDFRHVLYTGKYNQLVLMSLKSGEEIGAPCTACGDNRLCRIQTDAKKRCSNKTPPAPQTDL